MSSWDDLIQVAMLGTDRQPLPQLAEGDPAGTLHLEGQSPEKQLLDQIAVHAYRQRAGALPGIRIGMLDNAAPADSLPRCSPEAAQSLNEFISGSKTWLVREWLELAQKTGVRPPDERLPDLLDAGRKIKSIRHLVFESIGERGRWLAEQRAEWLYATFSLKEPASIDKILSSGKALEKQFALERVRAADPEKGRELIIAQWPDAAPRLRTIMLDLMIPQLSSEDEPFLDSLLEQKAVSVKRRTAELLSRLPQSRYCARMAEQSRKRIRWVAASRRQSAYLAYLSDSGQEISRKVASFGKGKGRNGMTEKGWQILHTIRATPLSTWQELYPYTIEEIISAGVASEWDRPIIRGWIGAADRQGNKEWAEALLFGCQGILESRYAGAPLIAQLEPDQREQLALHILESPGNLPEHKRYAIEATALRECKHGWSDSFARQVTRHFQKYIRVVPIVAQPHLILQRTLRQVAIYYPPSLYEECKAELEPLAATYKRWQSSIQGFLRIMEIRAQLHRALGDLL